MKGAGKPTPVFAQEAAGRGRREAKCGDIRALSVGRGGRGAGAAGADEGGAG